MHDISVNVRDYSDSPSPVLARNETLKTDEGFYKAKFTTIVEQHVKLQKRVFMLELGYTTKNQQLGQVRKDNFALYSENNHLAAKLSTEREMMEEERRKMDEFTLYHKRYIDSYAHRVSSLEKEIKRLVQENKGLTQENIHLTENNLELMLERDGLEAEVDRIDRKRIRMNSGLQNLASYILNEELTVRTPEDKTTYSGFIFNDELKSTLKKVKRTLPIDLVE